MVDLLALAARPRKTSIAFSHLLNPLCLPKSRVSRWSSSPNAFTEFEVEEDDVAELPSTGLDAFLAGCRSIDIFISGLGLPFSFTSLHTTSKCVLVLFDNGPFAGRRDCLSVISEYLPFPRAADAFGCFHSLLHSVNHDWSEFDAARPYRRPKLSHASPRGHTLEAAAFPALHHYYRKAGCTSCSERLSFGR